MKETEMKRGEQRKKRRKRERRKDEGKREGEERERHPVCTSPCEGSKRLRVYRQNARMLNTHTTYTPSAMPQGFDLASCEVVEAKTVNALSALPGEAPKLERSQRTSLRTQQAGG